MDWKEVSAYCSLAGLAIIIIRDVLNGSWKLGGYLRSMEGRLSQKIDENRKAVDASILQVEAELESRIRELESDSQHLREDLGRAREWVLEKFVGKQSFEAALTRIERVTDSLDAWLRQLQAQQRAGHPPPPV